jgi:hypothetical protein
MLKQKDIALIAAAIIVGAIISIVVSRLIFGAPAHRSAQVEQVQAISPDFPTPSHKYFNKHSIDPTHNVHISNQENNSPFKSSQQGQ